MPSYSQPIAYDRQVYLDQDGKTVSNSEFEPIGGAGLTTSDLGEPGDYIVIASLILSASLPLTTLVIRALVDGTPITPMGRTLLIKTSNNDIGYTILGRVEALGPGVTVMFEWKTDKGVVTLSEISFVADGLPGSRIV